MKQDIRQRRTAAGPFVIFFLALILIFSGFMHGFAQSSSITDSARGLISLGSYERAVAILEQGTERYKDSVSFHRLLGQAYLGMRKFDKAIDEFLHAAYIDDCDSCSVDYDRVGEIFLEGKAFKSAIKYFEKALMKGSKTAKVKIGLASLNEGGEDIKRHDYNSAINALKVGIETPEDTLLYERLLYCYFMNGDDY